MENKYPTTLINIHLPDEPMTKERSWCLRQMSNTQWCVCYYDEDGDYFYSSVYFDDISFAYEAFHIELNKQMNRLSYHIRMFYKYRSYITSQESK